MSTSTVPMFDPEGTLREVPYEQMQDAVKAGGFPAVQMKDPTGTIRHVPANRIKEASDAGGTMVPLEAQEVQHPGFWADMASEIGNIAKGIPKMAFNLSPPGQALQAFERGRQGAAGEKPPELVHAEEQKKAGYNTVYRVLTPAAEALGQDVAGSEQAAKEGDIKGVAAKAAAPLAVMAATAGAAKVSGMAEAPVRGAAKGVRGYFSDEAAQGELARTKTLVKTETEAAQADLQQGLRDHMKDVAKEEGVTPQNPKSIRDVMEDTADQIYAKSKSQYAQIDKATGGKFQRFSDALKRIDREIHKIADIDPDKEGALIEQRNTIQDQMDSTFEEAKQAGLDPKLVDQANANFKKSMALYDVDKQLNFSTKGFRKGLDEGGQHTLETVDSEQFSKRLEKLYKTGRLQEAIGDKAADEMVAKVDKSIVRRQNAEAALESAEETAKKAKETAISRKRAAAAVVTGGVAEEGLRRALK